MPDDNRFAGLSDVVEEEPDTDGNEHADETEDGSPASTGTATDDDTVEATYDDPELELDDVEDDESDAEADDDAATDPAAFSFDATTKKTVYVRQGTIDDLEDARALVDAQLRTQHDVRDLTGREFYDAVFRLAADDTDGLIEEIRDERDD
ncbi:hypothetical protein [Halomontanus rarus]|uniref:hypothetical protein n=1 Tax=Halomontanus rarus TaxID=3034020 RepID=UPI0023E866FB|nr:hypothetical protein [Halovivax sp. TS33]